VPFRSKIFLGSVVAAVVSLVASELWLARQIREREEAALADRLADDARLIAFALETGGARQDLDALAQAYGLRTGARVTLIADDGRVVGESTLSAAERGRLDNHAGRPEVQAAARDGFGSARRYSDTVRADMVYVVVRAVAPVVRYVRVAMPTTDLETQLAALRRISLVGLAVGVPVALLVAWLASAPLARRVQDIARAAQSYKEGHIGASVPEFGDDELGMLAQTLDGVARELAQRVSDLSQDRARIDAILGGMVEGVVVVDAGGRLQRVNQAARRLLGVAESALGAAYGTAIGDAAVVSMIDGASRGHADTTSELVLHGAVARTVVARASAVPADRGGGAVLVLHDISDIRRVDRVRQDFVANVSHELRTPLTVIRGYAESLADGSHDVDDVGEFGAMIVRHTAKMERLVTDLLRLARLDAHQEVLQLGRCDLTRLFEDLTRDFAPLLRERRQRVALHVSSDAATVVADGSKLYDVLRNLVDNAVTYVPEGAEIRLEAWADQGAVRLVVADNGPGIPSEALPRVFERFYRADPSRARPGGTGLGLAIVKHLVELHGGTVSVSNGALGGAVFTVVLPRPPVGPATSTQP
jgi:two-component system phosphate regulon sensor histidine kinase PhoR